MSRKNAKLLFVKIMFIVGIILDGLCAVEMLTGAIMGDNSPFLGMAYSISGDTSYQYAMFIAGIFMLGWTALLFWGVFKPLERKEILIITWIPVVIGLGVTHFIAYFLGLYTISDIIIRGIINGILNIGLVVSYIFAWNLAKKK